MDTYRRSSGQGHPVVDAPTCLADLHGSAADPLLDTMNFLNEVTARYPQAISFAPGRPYDGLFDPASIAEYLDAYTDYLLSQGHTSDQVRAALFQYGRTKGQIHELIAETVANDEDIRVPPESVVVTVGAQEAMFLLLRVLFSGPQDVLLVSSPCYVGITGAARLLDIEVIPVPESGAGPDPDAARQAARQHDGRRPQDTTRSRRGGRDPPHRGQPVWLLHQGNRGTADTQVDGQVGNSGLHRLLCQDLLSR